MSILTRRRLMLANANRAVNPFASWIQTNGNRGTITVLPNGFEFYRTVDTQWSFSVEEYPKDLTYGDVNGKSFRVSFDLEILNSSGGSVIVSHFAKKPGETRKGTYERSYSASQSVVLAMKGTPGYFNWLSDLSDDWELGMSFIVNTSAGSTVRITNIKREIL